MSAPQDALEPISGRVAVVGPCAAGKSVLVKRLQRLGYDARHSAQEHSYVPNMWQRLTRPEVLVYLDASTEVIQTRREIRYGTQYLVRQRERLAHARAHCDIYVNTDSLTEEQVFATVVQGLAERGLLPS